MWMEVQSPSTNHCLSPAADACQACCVQDVESRVSQGARDLALQSGDPFVGIWANYEGEKRERYGAYDVSSNDSNEPKWRSDWGISVLSEGWITNVRSTW